MNTALHLLVLAPADGGAARHVHIDAEGRLAGAPVPGACRILVVPGQSLAVRRLPPGPATDAQARAAAWHALRAHLASPPEQLAWEVGEPADDGSRWVAAFDPSLRDAWQAAAAAEGFVPARTVPACLLPPPPGRAGQVVVWDEGPVVHARGEHWAFSAEPPLAAAVIGEAAVEHLSADDPALPWRGAGAAGLPDLGASARPGRPEVRAVPTRRLAALAAAVIVGPLLVFAAQGLRHEIAASRIQAATDARLLAVEPAAAGPGRPLARAHASLARRLSAQQPAPALAALLQAQSTLPGTRLRSLAYAEDGVIELRWEHDPETPAPRLAEALAAHGFTATATGSEPAGARVQTTLLLSELP